MFFFKFPGNFAEIIFANYQQQLSYAEFFHDLGRILKNYAENINSCAN